MLFTHYNYVLNLLKKKDCSKIETQMFEIKTFIDHDYKSFNLP